VLSTSMAATSVRGRITSYAFFSWKSNTPASMAESLSSSVPWARACITSMRSSSGVWTWLFSSPPAAAAGAAARCCWR
jgi:hypothetical protein